MTVTKILTLAANPSDTTRLRLPEEVREIQEGLALSEGREKFELISQWAVRPDDLRRALLKYDPEIVHFSGHGANQQGLLFENEMGQATLVHGATLAKLFELCTNVTCVLLSACYSEVQAEAIAQHVDYVIGMNQAIGDRAAIKFAVGFYDALGYGRPIEEAFQFGLLAIDLENIPEADTPVLYIQKDRDSKPGVAYPNQLAANRPAPTQTASINTLFEPSPAEKSPTRDMAFAEVHTALGSNLSPNRTETAAAPTPVKTAKPKVEWEEPQGLVPLYSPFYIERSPIESDCYETSLRRGSLIRIKAPRQMGKTSLLVRVLDHAKQQGFKTVQLNLQTADATALNDLNEFLQWFCCIITEELDLPDKLAEYWQGSRGTVRRCQRYFERYLLTEINKPILLGLDEVDQVFEHPEIATDFFGMLRVWHEEGKSDPKWANLHLVIVHSKEVYVPLSINRSPFNVGLPVDLRELNYEEVLEMVNRHQLDLSDDSLMQLTQLVGGHPYLLRVALTQLLRGRETLSSLLTNAPTEGGLYNDHLRRHLLNLEADPALVKAFQAVIETNSPVQIGSTEAFKLSSMGLVKYQGNSVVPLCELYRQYFRTRL
ncbi:MAG: AAA-like domain-containing protein [Cyanobacteria bacterium J06560_2]